MNDVAYWRGPLAYSGIEAARLIVGMNAPDINREHLVLSVYRAMHASFIDTCGWFRDELEHEEGLPFIEDVFLDDAYPSLLSRELANLYKLVTQARRYRDYLACKEFALNWLDQNVEEFDRQQFSAISIAQWLEAMGIRSAFVFSEDAAPAPEDRLAQIKQVVEDCGGNKSAAARKLGISRQRVDQLLSVGRGEGRKGLRKGKASPFDI